MTYPPGPPGTSGYPPAQPSGAYGSSTPSFAKPADAESKLPLYLQIAVLVLGFGVYLGNFGPILSVADSEYPVILGNAGYSVPLALFAALLAGAGLLPKAKVYTPIIAVTATVGALVAINTSLGAGDNYTIGWGLWLVLTFSILQAAAAVVALLLEAGVITAPAPRPKYDPYAQYGLPPGNSYYGQPGQPGQPGAPQGYGTPGQPGAQPSGYPSYGGFSQTPQTPQTPSSGGFGAPSTPQSGGFGSAAPATPPATPPAAPSTPQGPPTPPTGFPSFSPPPGGGSGSSAPTVQTPGSSQSQGGSASSGPAQP